MIRNWTLVSAFAALAMFSWAQPPGQPGQPPPTVQNIPRGTPERGNTPPGLDPRQLPDSPDRGTPPTPAARDQLVRPGQTEPVPAQTGEQQGPGRSRPDRPPTGQRPGQQGQTSPARPDGGQSTRPETTQSTRPDGPQPTRPDAAQPGQPQRSQPSTPQNQPSAPQNLLEATERVPGVTGAPTSNQTPQSPSGQSTRPGQPDRQRPAEGTPAQQRRPDAQQARPDAGEARPAVQTPSSDTRPAGEPSQATPGSAASETRPEQPERPRPTVSPDATPFVPTDMPEHLQRSRPGVSPTPVTGEAPPASEAQAPATETPAAPETPAASESAPSETPAARQQDSPAGQTPATSAMPPVGDVPVVGQTPPAGSTPRPGAPESTPGTAPGGTPAAGTPPPGGTPPPATGTPGAPSEAATPTPAASTATPSASPSPSPATPGASPSPGADRPGPAVGTPITEAGRRLQEERRRRRPVSAEQVRPEDLNPAAAELLDKSPSTPPTSRPDATPPRPELTPYIPPQVVTDPDAAEQSSPDAPVLVMPPPGATPTPTPAPERIIVNDTEALRENLRKITLAPTPPPAPTPGATPPPVPPGVTPVPRDFRPDRDWVPYPGWRPPNNWSPPRGWTPPGGWSPPPGWNPPREWVPRLRNWGWSYIPRRGWVVPVQWSPPPDFIVPPNWYYLPPSAYDAYGFHNPAEVVVMAGHARPDLQVNISVNQVYTPPPPPPIEMVPPPPRPAPPEPPPMPAQITSVQTVAQVLTRPRDPNGPRYQGPVLVAESVHFDFDSYAIKPDSFPTLDAIGQALISEIPDAILNVEGHTDSDGSDEYNQNLSEQRAWSVKSYLVQRFGIDPNRLIIVGYGERAPIASNSTEQGKALNRRVEFENVTDLYQAQVLETAQPEY